MALGLRFRLPQWSVPFRLLLVALVTVLPALVLLVYGEIVLRRDRVKEIDILALQQTELAAAEMREIENGVRHLLMALSQMPALREHDVAACNRFLTDVQRQFPGYLAIAAADAAGTVFCRGAANGLAAGGPVADRAYFRRALTQREFAVGGYVVGRGSGAPVIQFAYPYLDDQGAVAGVVFTALSLKWLEDDFRRIPWQPASSVTHGEEVRLTSGFALTGGL